MTPLNKLFSVRRRFMRSVNLERDGESPESLEGYVLTPRTSELAGRLLQAFAEPHRTRAWTLTGVYGTGKSSFANFAAALFANRGGPVRKEALKLIRNLDDKPKALGLVNDIPEEGLVRAVATGRREPLAHTVVRALAHGAERFWAHRRGRKPGVVTEVLELRENLDELSEEDVDVAELTKELAEASGTGLILILDELGKILEHVGRSGGKQDLYLLQRLAELPAGPDHAPVLVLGLLHQSFSEYGQLLSSSEQAEWGKIQGRFEDIPFSEPAEQMLRIMGQAIEFEGSKKLASRLAETAERWSVEVGTAAPDPYIGDVLQSERTRDVLPLHPIAALILPTLCARYGQNERSLFTFLASNEPHSLARFLEEQRLDDDGLPLLRLPAVYDYFVDVAKVGSANRVQMTRWSEINTVVRDAKGLAEDEMEALKTVGTLNLVSSGGPLRASKRLVLLSLLLSPDDTREMKRWEKTLASLVDQGFLTYRTQVDEFRLWQGSDFDIEEAVQEKLEAERRSLAQVLQNLGTPSPVVAQRHSYQTGTLRYFERRYADESKPLDELQSEAAGSDGVIAYWVGESSPKKAPAAAADGVPLVVLEPHTMESLRSAAMELGALLAVDKHETALQADGVARKELKHRVALAREVLQHAIAETFDRAESRTIWVRGKKVEGRHFNGLLSSLFDRVYAKGPTLWNEIINRRKLTSQGAKAQRELITALVTSWDEPRFGIEGTGPDYSIYSSVFEASGMHGVGNEEWVLRPPTDNDDVALRGVWSAIEEFCLSAVEEPRTLDELYELLQRPPYGVKEGLIPVVLAAVLVYHSEDVSIYQEGSFVPALRPAHFELLVKRPEFFAVKHFELGGVKFSDYRKVLEQVGEAEGDRLHGVRNETLLNVVRPLVQFAVSLPDVTKNAIDFSHPAMSVRKALLTSREPDDLIFRALPAACGFKPFRPGEKGSRERRKEFLPQLTNAVRELRTHYDRLLKRCETLIHQAFGVRSSLGDLRDDLRFRAKYLMGGLIDPRVSSFVKAAADEEVNEREWLESIVMIIADRPADTWTEGDLAAFELNVGEMARRFANLEALQKEIARAPKEGFDAKRITITAQTGKELERVVWIERDAENQIEKKADEMVGRLGSLVGQQLREAVLVRIAERILNMSEIQKHRDVAATTPIRKEKHA